VLHHAIFVKIGQTVAEIWRFNGLQDGGRLPSWIFKILFDPISGDQPHRDLQKAPSLRRNTSYDVHIIKIGPPVFAQLTLFPNPEILYFTMLSNWPDTLQMH